MYIVAQAYHHSPVDSDRRLLLDTRPKVYQDYEEAVKECRTCAQARPNREFFVMKACYRIKSVVELQEEGE
jgi:hypothetical protein